MSLPYPSTHGNASYPDPKDFAEFEKPLIELAHKSKGDLRRLLTAFFGFLHQRTDFYCVSDDDAMGFKMGDAERLLLASFRQFPLRKIPKPEASASKPEIQSTPNKTPPADQAPAPFTPSKHLEESSKDIKQESVVRLTEEGLQIPVGNGGSTDRYQWTQTLDEVTVIVPVEPSLRGRDLDVTVAPLTVTVRTKQALSTESAPKTYVTGTLSATIDPSESTWTLEGSVIQLILYKKVKTFWKSVFEGDPEIDTELVDNRRDIRSYDEATQAKLRQVMFDQQQMAKGLPTSEQQTMPELPPGVEFIDKKVLEDNEAKKE